MLCAMISPLYTVQARGKKEMSLLQLILERAVRKGMIAANPLIDLEKLPTVANQKHVSDDDLSLAWEVGKNLSPSQQIVALALQTAYLCVRRSVEVRDLTRDGLTDEGIVWVSGKIAKRNAKLQVLIEWSPDLRAVIDEALAVDRGQEFMGAFIFGRLRGERYTKGGWKSVLKVLMDACAAEAEKRGVPFERFSLQDLRSKGVSDKLDDGAEDVLDATLHTVERISVWAVSHQARCLAMSRGLDSSSKVSSTLNKWPLKLSMRKGRPFKKRRKTRDCAPAPI